MKTYLLNLFCFLMISHLSVAQVKHLYTSNFANVNFDEDTTEALQFQYDKSGYFTVGLLSMDIFYPKNQTIGSINQKGFFIGNRKNSSNIDEIVLSDAIGLYFNIGTENTIGFATSTDYLLYSDGKLDTVQHYTGILNLFSYNINSELIFKLPMIDRKIIGGVSLTFFNLGVTATYMKGGRYDGKLFGATDLAPFYIQFSGKFSLKNATFGLGMFINPYSFAEYRFGPKEFINDNDGIYLNSAQYKKFALMFFAQFR